VDGRASVTKDEERVLRGGGVSPLARSGYSYAPFIVKSEAACGPCFDQLGWPR